MKDLFNFTIPQLSTNFEEPDGPNGPLIIHNVPIMVSGTWTSHEGKAFEFTPEMLKAAVDAWDDNLVWQRHPLIPNENRPATDSIGAVPKRYFEPNFTTVLKDGTTYKGAAIMGDVVLHRKTDVSKDAAKLIRLPYDQGGFRMVSAETEMQGLEYNSAIGAFQFDALRFHGLTIQREGGCAACNIPAFSAGTGVQKLAKDKEPAAAAPPTPGGAEEDMPKWAAMLCQKFDAMCEAVTKGAMSEKAGMASPGVALELFSAIKTEVDSLKEENRKLVAMFDKASNDPKNALTAKPEDEEKISEDTKTSINLVRQGKNLYMRRDG